MRLRSLPSGLPAFLSRVLPSAQLPFFSLPSRPGLWKLYDCMNPLGELVKIMGSESVGLVWGQRFCISARSGGCRHCNFEQEGCPLSSSVADLGVFTPERPRMSRDSSL